MPKIKITDTDYSTGLISFSNSQVVYIPGPTIRDSETGYADASKPVLCVSIADLTNAAAANNYDTDSLSYRLASYLINTLGAPVLYEGVASVTPGTEQTIKGSEVVVSIDVPDPEVEGKYWKTTKQHVEKITEDIIKVPAESWERLKDKTLYDVRFLTTGALPSFTTNESYDITRKYEGRLADDVITYDESASSTEQSEHSIRNYTKTLGYVDEAMTGCANARKDCVALIESSSDLLQSADVVEAIRTAVAPAASKYAAAFTPAFISTVKSLSQEDDMIPACFGYLFAYFRSLQNNPEWKAAAGVARGIIPELSAPLYEFTNAEGERLQGRTNDPDNLDDNTAFGINPIMYVRPYGFVVWGNRTLYFDAEKGLQASCFLNVRQLVTTVIKRAYDTARRYTFAQNSDILWVNFCSQLRPMLDQMRSGEGIFGYKLVRVATKAKARLAAKIIIAPIEAVEDFEIEVELVDSDALTINE